MTTQSTRWKTMLLAGLTLATVGCDQATKYLAATHLGAAPRSFWHDTIRFEYAENAGAFLGLGATWPFAARVALFVVGTAMMLVAVATLYARVRWSTRSRFGIGLLWAGGLSNLIDRALYGRVPDFLNVGVGSLRTGIFNVADVVILLGSALLLLDALRVRRTRRQ
jgi:signal peptidase II